MCARRRRRRRIERFFAIVIVDVDIMCSARSSRGFVAFSELSKYTQFVIRNRVANKNVQFLS